MNRRRPPLENQQSLFALDDTPSDAPTIVDAAARRHITLDGLADTLFIEAGAGSGKTTTIVERIVNLVVVEGVELQHIAAITFTEAAAAELRDRVRAAFERTARQRDGEARRRSLAALEQSDIAAISTLHSFAQRVLSEHPVEAGVPPRFEVLDEVQSILALDARWRLWLDAQLADPANHPLIEWSVVLRIDIARRRAASLKDVARVFNDNWDRLEASPIADPGPLAAVDLSALHCAAAEVLELADEARDADDKLAQFIAERRHKIEQLRDGTDALEVVVLINSESRWSSANGQKKNWPDVERVRAATAQLAASALGVVETASAAVLMQWRWRLAAFTLEAAEQRRREGTLEFHDLLVLARRLVRRSASARRALHDRYTHLVIDEFQDTDPIQIELVTLIATDVEEIGDQSWQELEVEPGRLCFVGDPKQSIYRFRRADVALFRQAGDRFAPNGRAVSLVQNFRTVPTVLQWINHVFGVLMGDEASDQQPRYEPLVAARTDCPRSDHRVVLLGGPHDETHRAETLRVLEANDVVRSIRSMMLESERWLVGDDDGGWREARFDDIVILVPSRLSLPALEQALRDADVPYRAEASTLVFDTQEVREPLIALQAIDDPSDEIAIVATLRSTLFGCGDDDLLEFATAGGRWDYRVAAPGSLPADHPVVAGLTYLRRCHDERLWLEPSELLERVLRERRSFELALLHRRPRDVWRRLRFVVEQARQFVEANRGGLRAFLSWAELQRYEGARVHEPLLPELDDNSVRIMTIHSAKGLEFPITIVSGLTTQRSGRRRGVGVHWATAGPEIKMSGGSTAAFDVLDDFEQEMDEHEKLRLLYVATTRARDHLVVSAHHVAPNGTTTAARETFAKMVWEQSATELDRSCRVLPPGDDTPFVFPSSSLESLPGDTAEARRAWAERRRELLARPPVTVAATAIAAALASTAPDLDAVPDGADEAIDGDSAVGSRTGTAAGYRRGRAGTAIGRAVHAVLQVADLASDPDVAALARTYAALEGVTEWVDTVVQSVEAARRSPAVQRAVAAPEHWRELFVAAPVEGRAIEGFIDLVFRDGDDLVVVDYKTDELGDDADIDRALVRYRPQAAAYALALESTTGRRVHECVFVFTRGGAVVERRVVGAELHASRLAVRDWLAGAV